MALKATAMALMMMLMMTVPHLMDMEDSVADSAAETLMTEMISVEAPLEAEVPQVVGSCISPPQRFLC